eukprot:GHVT01017158.1.p1 GENE.GHVT01017158.1~~GHVT01017158.1.p1  ORF type:complete len:291 (+),score=63.80 GHVT01017158.1:111-983(+)
MLLSSRISCPFLCAINLAFAVVFAVAVLADDSDSGSLHAPLASLEGQGSDPTWPAANLSGFPSSATAPLDCTSGRAASDLAPIMDFSDTSEQTSAGVTDSLPPPSRASDQENFVAPHNPAAGLDPTPAGRAEAAPAAAPTKGPAAMEGPLGPTRAGMAPAFPNLLAAANHQPHNVQQYLARHPNCTVSTRVETSCRMTMESLERHRVYHTGSPPTHDQEKALRKGQKVKFASATKRNHKARKRAKKSKKTDKKTAKHASVITRNEVVLGLAIVALGMPYLYFMLAPRLKI